MSTRVRDNYKAKAIVIESIFLVNYDNDIFDLREFITGFRLYEDIMTNTMVLDIGVVDAVALIERFPLVGDERVVLQFFTPTFDSFIDVAFDVYKIDGRSKATERGDLYNIKCISREFIESSRKVADKAYVGFEVSDVVKNVYDLYLKDSTLEKNLVVERTLGKHSFIAPLDSPLNFIRMLATEARSKEYSQDSYYLFYEDHEQFNFRTVASLYDQDPVYDLYYAESDLPENNKEDGRRKVDASQKVLDIQFEPTIDILGRHQSGFYDNEALVVDPIFKSTSHTNYIYDRDFDKVTTLADNRVLSERSRYKDNTGRSHSRLFVGSLSTGNYYQTSYLNNRCTPIEPLSFYPSFRHKFINRTIGFSAGLLNMGINMTIPGNSDIKAGSIVNFYMPTNSKDTELDQQYNKFFGDPENGAKFLVVRVTHTYTTESQEYITELKLVKDTFANEITTELSELSDNEGR